MNAARPPSGLPGWTDPRTAVSLAAWAVPALTLCLPSGYSYGAAALLLLALAWAPRWWRQPLADRRVVWLAWAVAAMGLVWALDATLSQEGARGFDKPLRFLAALPCLLLACRYPPRPLALWLGVATGAVGGGVLALVQYGLYGLERANGFTNAIQFGNLSLLLGLMSALGLLAVGPAAMPQWSDRARLALRVWLVLGAVLGAVGSLLSQSRGGWLALLLALPVLWLAARPVLTRGTVVAGLSGLLLLGATLPWTEPLLNDRLAQATEEVQAYQEDGNAESSVGHRLAHWKMAFEMGLEKPLLGWNLAGYTAEKARLVANRQVQSSVLLYSHAHNEYLDLFVKRGLLGLGALLLLYGLAFRHFWPRERDRQAAVPGVLALQLAGLALVVCYAGFGLTQVFLSHNNGTMFLLFMLLLLVATLGHAQRGGTPDAARAPG